MQISFYTFPPGVSSINVNFFTNFPIMSSFYVSLFVVLVLSYSIIADRSEKHKSIRGVRNRNGRHCKYKPYAALDPFYRKSVFESPFNLICIVFLGILFGLMFLGCLKGTIGICCSKKVGEYGMPMLIDLPKPLDYYQELSLKGREVCYDVVGWPVHPDTGERSVRVLQVKTEFCLNTIFFLAYPLALVLKLCSICCCIRDYKGEQDEFFKEVNVIKYDSGKNDPGPKVDIYKENDLREAKDTRYVINCMRESQITLQELNKFGN